jgi:hypothetical protein
MHAATAGNSHTNATNGRKQKVGNDPGSEFLARRPGKTQKFKTCLEMETASRRQSETTRVWGSIGSAEIFAEGTAYTTTK